VHVSEVVVLSHLRWTWVWQRPQQVASRIAEGRRVWFVERPRTADVPAPRLATEEAGPVTRVWLEVPAGGPVGGFDDPALAALLPARLGAPGEGRAVWLLTPDALDLGEALDADVVVYDVMEHRDSDAHWRAVERADVVFTAGRAIHEAVLARRAGDVHLFASGVEPEHYTLARQKRRPPGRTVAGYLGVIDQRLDLDLLAGVADALPDWELRLVGPVVGLDEDDLPRRPNITVTGPREYRELPEVLSGFDVALLPFLVNDVTRATSPTKTLEYLAAGLPVVSTRLPGVVADFSNLVTVEDDAAGFARACVEVKGQDPARRERTARPVLHWHHWDTVTARMDRAMTDAAARRVPSVSPSSP
jgi:glycosyltransferase involved in cell wall biosynthesis